MSQSATGQAASPDHDKWVKSVLGVDFSGAGAGPAAPAKGPGNPGPGNPGPGNPDTMTRSAAMAGAKVGWVVGKSAALTDEQAYGQAVAGKQWGTVAELLNKVKAPELKKRMTQFSTEEMDALYKAACSNPKVGAKSAVALFVETLSHPVVGSMQKGRAAEIEKSLSKKDKEKYDKIMAGAKSQSEKDYITKGLASKHSVAELEKFAQKIAGKDADWLRDNLSLTGASDGSGVKQQWHHSCGPTTFEAVQGELDPLYALKMHEDNKDVSQVNEKKGDDINPNLAADQKKVLKAGGGKAVDRNKGGGDGMWITKPLNKISGSTGLKYALKKIPGEGTVSDGIKALQKALAKGEPVPISIGNGAKDYHHYVLVTSMDPGPPCYYTIHDPWDGKTVIRSQEQMEKGAINIANCNDLESWDEPSAVPAKKK